jgi:hypothetical protein
MKSRRQRDRWAQLRPIAVAVTLTLMTAMATVTSPSAVGEAIPASAEQQAVDTSVAAAAAKGITQSISVVDRETGATVAESGGDDQYISESIVKPFTVAYYLHQADGEPNGPMKQTLSSMIVNSDDDIETALWNVDIVPTMAARYGLTNTVNGPETSPHDWGWELITANDEVKFLYEMSNDPEVAPLLMDAMTRTGSTGADGSDQSYGMNSLSGDHGSKQGWTDVGADASSPTQIHSVGWSDQYFVAILETSAEPNRDEMRNASTAAAWALAGAPSAVGAAPAHAGEGDVTDLIAMLRHDSDVLIAEVIALIGNW